VRTREIQVAPAKWVRWFFIAGGGLFAISGLVSLILGRVGYAVGQLVWLPLFAFILYQDDKRRKAYDRRSPEQRRLSRTARHVGIGLWMFTLVVGAAVAVFGVVNIARGIEPGGATVVVVVGLAVLGLALRRISQLRGLGSRG
jgi:hypothetical protein